jgi:hypothetical protein
MREVGRPGKVAVHFKESEKQKRHTPEEEDDFESGAERQAKRPQILEKCSRVGGDASAARSDSAPDDAPLFNDDIFSQQSSDSDLMLPNLTPEERKVLKPPRKAIVYSKSHWEPEPLPQILMEALYVEPEYRDELEFDHDWTQEDETKLWRKWSVADELVLDTLQPGEYTVWRKAKHLFNIPAPKIIPPLLVVNPQGLRPIETKVKTRTPPLEVYLEHVDWGQGFCTLFVKLLCCGAFATYPAFLRYVLQYAVHFRVGEKKCPKPRKAEFLNGNDD